MTGARTSLSVLVGVTGLLGFAWTLHADPPAAPAPEAKGKSAAQPDDEKRVSVAEARERAKLMHDIYSATLDSMHHHFFRRDRAVLPARALDDVFAEIDKKTKIKTRWIAVNTPLPPPT